MSDEITARAGSRFCPFDGRVLETFGGSVTHGFHVCHMHFRVTGPDRKGRRSVEICHGQPEERGIRRIGHHSAAEWDGPTGLARLLETVQAAIDSVPEQ
ncbi:hypothetical protein ACGFN1_16970 [Streptomyces sp. NPDC048685]|uniref:hypothetical protein n=1 Tax=Streptomyces sp. NPDC048685 TaxID=3365584 RepID=UPI0037118695